MKKALALVLTLCMVFALAIPAYAAKEATGLPVKEGDTIRIICPYGAGGVADNIARKWGEVATKNSEYNFIVENLTGGDGFLANTEYSEYPVDTSDLLIHGLGVIYRHDNGKEFDIEEVDFDRAEIQPVVMVDSRTWVLYAPVGVTLTDLIEKAQSTGLKMSGGNPLSDPHLCLGSLMALVDGNVMAIPYDGGANQLKALIDGEVDCFVGAASAGKDYVEAGQVVPLLALGDKVFEGFTVNGEPISVKCVAGDDKHEELPADVDFSGSILLGGGYIATRTGASQEWVDKIIEISKAVWADEEFYGWIEDQLLNVESVYGQDAIDQANACAKVAREAFLLLAGEEG